MSVKYRDDTEAFTYLTQYSLSQFAIYCQMKGWEFNAEKPGLLGILMIRFQAWAEMFSDVSQPRPAFEKWDSTVLSVDPVGKPESPDPTQRAASDS